MISPRLIATARGERPADLVLRNGRIINVFSGRIIRGDIAIARGRIAGIGAYEGGEGIDLAGRFVCPGFIDAHVHIESALVSVRAFARAVAPLGTTTVVADPHEIANVLGMEGIRYMLSRAEGQPVDIRYALPSCVPATRMETSGAALSAGRLLELMDHERVVGLAEVMNYPGVIHGDPAVLDKIALALRARKTVDGHAPGVTGMALNAYLAAGVGSDHECTTAEEAREKLEAGMTILVREGTCSRNLEALLPLVGPQTWQRMCWCTDDRHPHDILGEGHIDAIARKAIALGLDPVTAIRMATISPALHFGLAGRGAVAPGYHADLLVFSDLNAPRAELVLAGGMVIAENGGMKHDVSLPDPPATPTVMNLRSERVRLDIPVQGERIRVIDLVPGHIATGHAVLPVSARDGLAVADPSRDLLKLAVVERYTGNAGTGLGFVRGFGLRQGALAASVAHDAHNLILAGASDVDMRAALNIVVEMGGGMAVVVNGRVAASLALPIAGLMADRPMADLRHDLDRLTAAARELGCVLDDPFMALSFLALPVVPSLKLTDKGLVDVDRFQLVDLFET